MTFNQGPPGKRSRRLSPDELAQEVAKRLKTGGSGRGEHRRRHRFDIVTVSRVFMALGAILLGLGVVFAFAWIVRLSGFETTGTVNEDIPLFECPGEPQIGAMFSGETVQLVGRTEDDRWYAVRDERGPGDVAFADAARISAADDPERLPLRSCEPGETSTSAGESTSTTALSTTTTTPGETTTTVEGTGATSGPPPRRPTPSPGTTTTTTTTTTPVPGSSSSTTPGSSSTTTPPGSSSTSTSSTTTTSTATTTSTTTPATTTTTLATTTTTEATTTTSSTTTSTTTMP